jgi:glycosyltransferase involved in cell wall biosynthesis
MEKLIKKAQINVLPSFSNTGIKLKLLHALFCGRHCIVNNTMVEETGLENICIVAEDENDFIIKVATFFSSPFTFQDIANRQLLLTKLYNNKHNTNTLINYIF